MRTSKWTTLVGALWFVGCSDPTGVVVPCVGDACRDATAASDVPLADALGDEDVALDAPAHDAAADVSREVPRDARAPTDAGLLDAGLLDAGLLDIAGDLGVPDDSPTTRDVADVLVALDGAADVSVALDASAVDAPLDVPVDVRADVPADVPLPMGPFPGVTTRRLVDGSIAHLAVANDERHLAFGYRIAPLGGDALCYGRLGLGDLNVATLDATTTTVHAITGNVAVRQSGFSGDSSRIVYAIYDASYPCSQGVRMYRAAADGTAPSSMSSTQTVVDFALSESGAFWRAIAYPTTLPGPLYAANLAPTSYTSSLGSGNGTRVFRPSPTGATLLYDRGGSMWVASPGRGPAVDLSTVVGGTPYAKLWSQDGDDLAVRTSAGGGLYNLFLVRRDGTMPRAITTRADGVLEAFSPDGRSFAYGEVDDRGARRVMVVPRAGGPAVGFDLPADFDLWFDDVLTFAGDTNGLHVRHRTRLSQVQTLVADLRHPDAFVTLADANYAYLDEVSDATHDHAAMLFYATEFSPVATVQLWTPAGVRATTVTGDALAYEQVTSSPRLAVWRSDQIELHPAGLDGPPVVLRVPGLVYRPFFWVGRTLYFGANATSSSGDFDLMAVSDDGATVGVVFPRVRMVERRPSGTPTRLFVTTRGENAGLYAVTLPAP